MAAQKCEAHLCTQIDCSAVRASSVFKFKSARIFPNGISLNAVDPNQCQAYCDRISESKRFPSVTIPSRPWNRNRLARDPAC